MKKLRHSVLAVLLTLTMLLTFIPAMAFAEPGDTPWYEQINSIEFIPAGDTDRFDIYKGIDIETGDEDDDQLPDFIDGDEIKATLTDGTTKTLTCHESYIDGGDDKDFIREVYWTIDYTEEQLGENIAEPCFETPHSWATGSNTCYVRFGGHYKIVLVTVKDNPVISISYQLVDAASERLSVLDGMQDDFDFDSEEGDILTVNWTTGQKKYIYTRIDGDDNDPGWEWKTRDGEILPYRFGTVDFTGFDEEDIEKWTVGSNNTIYVEFVDKSFSLNVTVEKNPVKKISFEPKTPYSYSVAELIMYESIDEYEDYNEDTEEYYTATDYYYDLEVNEGDKLIVTDTAGNNKTFEYKEYEYVDPESGNSWEELDFVYGTGDEREFIYNKYFMGPYYENDSRITARTKAYNFTVEYMGRSCTVPVKVTTSTNDEIKLAEKKRDAIDELNSLDEKYDISNKISDGKYRDAQVDQLYAAWDEAVENIEKAKTEAEINQAVAAYENALKTIKTDEQMKENERNEAARRAATDLANAKTSAKSELSRVNLGQYKEPELSNVRTAIANGRTSIDAAGSIAAVNNAKNAALNTINKQAKYNGKLPKVTISKPAKGSKSLTAKWKKLSKANQKKVKGIDIQYAQNKNFTMNAKIVTVKKSAASKKIGKLAKKKSYWVRVRTYQVQNGVKTVGAWSKVKTIKTN